MAIHASVCLSAEQHGPFCFCYLSLSIVVPLHRVQLASNALNIHLLYLFAFLSFNCVLLFQAHSLLKKMSALKYALFQ